MNVCKEILRLTEYGICKGLIEEMDRNYIINQYLALFGEDSFQISQQEQEELKQAARKAEEDQTASLQLEEILGNLTEIALEKGMLENDGITQRDLFDTRLMGVLTPRPSQVTGQFYELYKEDPLKATDYFYTFSQDNNYIRRERIKKDRKWKVASPYGDIDITINLSKPEKDPKAIAAARTAAVSSYPACLLCVENEGYAGRVNHPARQNHRIIPVTIRENQWGFQYSPYVYYNEHCIVFNGQHVPMKIDKEAFEKLLDFIDQFPHYFVGSNADLPIVGGSILSHDHFQGGHYTFAMEEAKLEKTFTVAGYEEVEAGIVHWPLSVIRLRSKDRSSLTRLADHILKTWRGYTDEEAFIFAETDGEPHNTITPIARMKDGCYEMDLTLRNNITTEEHPLGVYHPHSEYHHIKKENIGLIEVMGLAVLPARLNKEMDLLVDCLVEGKDRSAYEELAKHEDWVQHLLEKYTDINEDNVRGILQEEIGQVFVKVLEDAGVYKCDEEGRKAFDRFVAVLADK